jgi:hypothetical protein
MILVDLPQPRDGQWPGVMLSHHDSASAPTLAVTIRSRAGHPDHKWFTDAALAIAFALDQADTWHLLLIDLRKSEAE